MNREHRHLDEPDLLELALDPRSAEARTALDGCAECAERLRALKQLVGRVRAAAHESPAVDGRRIAAVLAATTREDLGARGDLHLIWRFARARLRSSALLRAAVVILAVHLAALPVLAWIALRAPARTQHFSGRLVLPVEPTYPAEPEREESYEPSVELPSGDPLTREVDPQERGERQAWLGSVRRADVRAWKLAAPSAQSASPRSDELAALLDTRAARLHGADVVPVEVVPTTIECIALRLEIALDQWALSDARPARIAALADELLAHADVEHSNLAACALHRAESFGLTLGPRWPELLRKGSAASEIARRMAREPLAKLWLESLATLAATGDAERARACAAWTAVR